MYQEHFGMVSLPFERDIASTALFESAQFAEATARLLYACQRQTMAVVTGDVGTGKSTLLRMLQDKLDKNKYLFIYIADSNLTPRNFCSLTLSHLALNPPSQLPKLKWLFKEVVSDLFEAKGKTCIIAIDEAQTLELSMVQEFRFILNFKRRYLPQRLRVAVRPTYPATETTFLNLGQHG